MHRYLTNNIHHCWSHLEQSTHWWLCTLQFVQCYRKGAKQCNKKLVKYIRLRTVVRNAMRSATKECDQEGNNRFGEKGWHSQHDGRQRDRLSRTCLRCDEEFKKEGSNLKLRLYNLLWHLFHCHIYNHRYNRSLPGQRHCHNHPSYNLLPCKIRHCDCLFTLGCEIETNCCADLKWTKTFRVRRSGSVYFSISWSCYWARLLGDIN